MSERSFRQLLIILAVVILVIGLASIWPPTLAVAGLIGLVFAVLLQPEDPPTKEG